MPWGIAAGVVGSVAGAAVSSAMSPSTSGGSGGGSGPSYYIPTGLQTADQQWQALQQGNINQYNNYDLAQYGNYSLGQGIQANNQYGPGYQNAANAAGQSYNALAADYSNQANQNWATQGQLQQQGQGINTALQNAGQQFYQTSLDPQSALYNRSVQQLQDQTGATNSMYGLGSSAAGAGVANQALGNFNIDWQSQQLARQQQGLQGLTSAYGQGASSMNSLYGTAGTYGQLAGNQANQIPGMQLASAQTPYQTAQSIAGTSGQLGNTFGQYLNSNVYSPAQSFQSQAIPYMNYGQGAQSIPYQQNAQGAGAAGALVGQGFSALGNNSQVQQSLGNAFSNFTNPASGSFSGGDFSGAFNSSPYYSGGGNSYGFTM